MSELPERLDLRSMDIAEDKRQAFLELLPEVRTEDGKVDFDRLKLALGEAVDVGRERYGMTWPGKAECFKTIQSPSLATLRPCPEESVNFDTTENLIIEGDNLEVLKLLQKSYLGKVKLIYIDPPYNTGNDFIYPDNFSESLQTYLQYSGQVDSDGRKFGTNTDADGRFHSKWLNMIYPRLYLARNLLSEDGCIFVSIDDRERRNLESICNDVFGEENFLAAISVQSNPRGRQAERFVATVHDYLLVYAKNEAECRLSGAVLSDQQRADYKFKDDEGRDYRLLGLRQRGSASRRVDRPEMYFPLYVNPETLEVAMAQADGFSEEVLPRKSTGEDGRWMWGKQKVRRDIGLVEARLIERRGEYDIFVRDYLDRGEGERTRKFKTIWDDKGFNTQSGTQELKSLLESDVMPYPKPVALLREIIQMGMGPDDTILDFFAGSGTTAQAALEANASDGGSRRFVLVQLPEPTGRDDYRTIAEVAKERVRRVINKLASANAGKLLGGRPDDVGFRVFKLAESNFKPWDAKAPDDAEALEKQLELRVDHISDDRNQGDLLYEILLKSGFPLTTPVTELQLKGKNVYGVAAGALLVCLERELTLELVRAIAAQKPERVVVLDEGFAGNDQLKTNAVLTFRDSGVTAFKTV